MLFVGLFGCAWAWVDQALAVAGQIALNELGDAYSAELSSVFALAGDSFSRAAQAAAWTRCAGRSPFHIASFDDWHFSPRPYVVDGFSPESPGRLDDTNLRSALYGSSSVLSDLRNGAYARPWTFAFAAKVVMGAICDSFAPLHTVELFSSEFPDGDRSGRRFPVVAAGRAASLFSEWESGCGAFADNLSFTDADWTQIDAIAERLAREWRRPGAAYSAPDTLRASEKFDREVVYSAIAKGAELTSRYRKNCTAETDKRIALAGYAIADYFATVQIPTFAADRKKSIRDTTKSTDAGEENENQNEEEEAVRKSEIVAWVLMAGLLLLLAGLIWKRHFRM
jgi:hypothetical protein